MGETSIKNKLAVSFLYNFPLLLFLTLLLFPVASSAVESLCAEVKIEIRQELTLERQAFDAHMRINNGLSHITLEDIEVEVSFTDDEGTAVLASSDPDNTDAIFFIRVDSMDNINAVDGTGTISPSTAADIHWLIIPAPESSQGLEQGTLYYVGATLSYTIGGEEHLTQVSPDYIYVKPLPEITLDYFLPEAVYGDDAFTTEIEPPVPYSLGLRVQNNGAGAVRSLKIQSVQPKIIENEQDLLISFVIEGSEVNGQETTKSLLVDLGDIAPTDAAVARWIMSCTLSGEFVEFNADFSHSDELGGELTSLIDAVNTHLILRDVLVDLPGRDSVRDFLAKDEDIFRVYESDSGDTVVSDQSSSANLQLVGQYGSEVHYTLSAPMTVGFMYVNLSDPQGGQKLLKKVLRSDGKSIKLENAWLSQIRDKDDPSHTWMHFVNLFDVNTTDSYTLVFDDIPDVPQAPVLQFIPDRSVIESQQLSFLVEASDPDGTIPSLTAVPLPVGAGLLDQGDGTAIFDWTPVPGQAGTYEVTFKASDGTLQYSKLVTLTVCPADDTDCDGMPDSWELEHFGDLTRDGTGDFDGDGISDLDEYLNSLDPAVSDNAPSIPVIQSPGFGTESATVSPELIIENSIDPEGDTITYEFELYSDSALTTLVASNLTVAETPDTTSWTVTETLNDNSWYQWRVRATDGVGYSLWAYGSFFINTADELPGAFHISSPSDNTEVDSFTPALEVTNSLDVDEDALVYTFEVYADSAMTTLITASPEIPEDAMGSTTWIVDTTLTDGTEYFWLAVATDIHGDQAETALASFTVNTANMAPVTPEISWPVVASEIQQLALDLVIDNVVDGNGDPLTYSFELDKENTFDSPAKQSSGPIPEVEDTDTTGWYVPGLEDHTPYYWRAKASDGAAESGWVYGDFFVNTQNDSPAQVTVRNPGENAWVETLTPTLSVNPCEDPDLDSLNYRFELYTDASLTDLVEVMESTGPDWVIASELDNNTRYYWQARAEDEHGLPGDWLEGSSLFVRYDGLDDLPQITILEPSVDLLTSTENILIQWEDSDPDSNATIALYYDTDETGEDGILITSGIEEDPDGTADSYEWDTTGVEGTYFIYATIADDVSTVTSYSQAVVTIDRTPPLVEADPAGGNFSAAQSVTLSADEPATIYYTLDSTEPTVASQVYDTAIEISASLTLKFRAEDTAGNQSTVSTEIYVIDIPEDLSVSVTIGDGTGLAGLNVYAFTEAGAYTGTSAVTDENGMADFGSPNDFTAGNYKFRADYLGGQFWSDPVGLPQTAWVELVIEAETAEVTVTTAAGLAPGVNVYLFTEGGAYLSQTGVTDENGVVTFTYLPTGSSFRFRADIMGNQYWSAVTPISGGSINNVPVMAGGGLFQVIVQEDPLTPMEGIRVYLFSSSGSYLSRNQLTDASGSVGFDLPQGNYQARADYLGYQFWSAVTPVSAATNIDLDIAHQDIEITINSLFQGTEPMPGVTVYLFTSSGAYMSQNQVTDPDGLVFFHLPETGYKVRADYLGQQFWSDVFVWQDPVVGVPMADAQVYVGWNDCALEGVPVYAFAGTGSYLNMSGSTDVDGYMTFRLPAGAAYKFRADYQNSQYWSNVETLTADLVNPIDISTGGGSFSFTVEKAAGEPLVGVNCHVFNEGGAYFGMFGPASSEGLVTFDLADGNYNIRVDYLGYQFWTDLYNVPQTLSDVFTIPHQEVQITVVGQYQGSAPMEGLTVHLFTADGSLMNQSQATDADGQVYFNLPEQAYQVRVDYLNQEYWSQEFTGMDTVVTIPLADAEVEVTGSSGPLGGLTVYVFSASGTYLGISGTTTADGKVTFRLPADTYLFRADHQSSQYWSEEEALTADIINPVSVSTGGGSFNFTVQKGVGDPIVGVNCFVFRDGSTYLGLSGGTNSEGQLAFDLAAGNYSLRVDYLGHELWTGLYNVPETLSEIFTITHQPVQITVEGQFDQESESLEGLSVNLFTPADVYMNETEVTDTNGQVSFDLPLQPYKVRADYLSHQFWSPEFIGTDTTVGIPMAEAQIEVTGHGVPLDGIAVYVYSAADSYLGISGVTTSDGKATFRLPADTYRFRVDYQSSQYWSQAEALTAHQVNSIPLNTGGGTFTLTVQKNAGQPMAGANCFVFRDGDTYLGVSSTTSSGGEVVFDLADGSFAIRVDYLGYQFWTPLYEVPVILSELFIIPHQEVQITVEGLYLTAEPLEGLTVYLFTTAGSYMSQTQVTDTAGLVSFDLPDQSYQVRADYLGQQFWSDPFQSQDTTVIINQGLADLHVHRAGSDLVGATVYLYSETGSYLNWQETTDTLGHAELVLPARPYQFRVDEGPDQVWAPVTNIPAGEVIGVEVGLD